jgi:hypothetical protein
MLVSGIEAAAEGVATTLFGTDSMVCAPFPLNKTAQRPPAKTKTPAHAPITQYFCLPFDLLIEPSLYHAPIVSVFRVIAILFRHALQQSYKFVTFDYPSGSEYGMLLP